jgi:importin-9
LLLSEKLYAVLITAAPHEFTTIPFPVKALKILVHDVQSGGESATLTAQGGTHDVDSDDGVSDTGSIICQWVEYFADQDEDWTEEEKLNQGFREDEFAFLSDMIGPRGMGFDNDDVLDDSDDEDLKSDPISQIDMQVSMITPYLLSQ